MRIRTLAFSCYVKHRNNSNGIHRLRVDNTILEHPKHIKEHILDFYKTFYSDHHSHSISTGVMEAFMVKYIPSMVYVEENMILSKFPYEIQIKTIVFKLNVNSAPRPDEFGSVFYYSC